MKRFFIVGCARSGTTLMQAMIAGHPSIHGFPETFYFRRAANYYRFTGWKKPMRRALAAKQAIEEAVDRLRTEVSRTPRNPLSSYSYHRRFLRILDEIAARHDCTAWSEKTPGHVNDIELIRELIPQVKIIHVLRDGRDVVASLEDIYRKQKPRGAWDLEESIRRWNGALDIAKNQTAAKDIINVSYDTLIIDPKHVLPKVCEKLDISFDPAMLDHSINASQILGRAHDKEARLDVLKPITNTHMVKYSKLFTEAERETIESQLFNGGKLPDNLDIVS